MVMDAVLIVMVLVGFALVWAAECRLLVTGELHGKMQLSLLA